MWKFLLTHPFFERGSLPALPIERSDQWSGVFAVWVCLAFWSHGPIKVIQCHRGALHDVCLALPRHAITYPGPYTEVGVPAHAPCPQGWIQPSPLVLGAEVRGVGPGLAYPWPVRLIRAEFPPHGPRGPREQVLVYVSPHPQLVSPSLVRVYDNEDVLHCVGI